MLPSTYHYIYFTMLSFSVIIGNLNYRHLGNAVKIIHYLLLFAIIGEISAMIVLRNFKTKSPAFHFTGIISLYIIYLYFLHTIGKQITYKYMVILGVGLLSLGIGNLYFQNILKLNSNILILRGFLVICMSLYALYRIFIDEKIIEPMKDANFWIWVCLLLLYGGTYFFWSYIKMLAFNWTEKYYYFLITYQSIINIISYSGIGCIFLLHPKIFKHAK